MRKRIRQFAGVAFASGILVQVTGCMPGLNGEPGLFLRDLSREALAAFLL